MLAKWPIRNKLLVGLALLLVLVATLSYSGFHGLYAYRGLVKALNERVGELPHTTRLSQQVGDLRVTLAELRTERLPNSPLEEIFASQDFFVQVEAVGRTLQTYRAELERQDYHDDPIGYNGKEFITLEQIETAYNKVQDICQAEGRIFHPETFRRLSEELSALQRLAAELPSHLHQRLMFRINEVRTQYRSLIVLTWLTSILAAGMFFLFVKLFYQWVFRPLRMLVKGSRKVAAGNFDYRLKLDTQDEMAELAEALNHMTASFCEIRDGLDLQVKERTKQVVRSERLASVGFLAAGVAHEINNPLASIAMCAESLEGRLRGKSLGSEQEDQVLQKYLHMIQTEAFRCKEITEKLLDFSRMGDVQKQATDLRELMQSVIDMLGHIGKYQNKQVQLIPGEPVVADVNGQEMKQVFLNLLTNALDSLDEGGLVWVELVRQQNRAVLIVTDNGAGMTEEVLEHLFEPFFTRRRGGQGTGLGLSITYRIVADHHGQLEAHSDGPGQGSQFRVLLPLKTAQKVEESREFQTV